ncbi:ParA family protein [Candidatus Avelusimicrobium alvi]|uniref:ParA family protein n=1 Tax=Candidatus Avelusimicrobium alvi TaxID=3416221 RepID=UPI003D0C7F2F
MKIYTFWNNKGGTGKTSLAFQTICHYAHKHPEQKILAVDMCPQANLSELLLGGLEGKGSQHLMSRHGNTKRASIGGYFQDRLPEPYAVKQIQPEDFITLVSKFNSNIPSNIHLICGDPILELQSNAVSTLANTSIPGTDTWIKVINWVSDLLMSTKEEYDVVFLDTNPSFSIYTQMALAVTKFLILPTMADDSSKRAIENAFSLIYGFRLPHPIYADFAFSKRMQIAHKPLPMVHLIIKNRLTQYMGAASAYSAVLETIDSIVTSLQKNNQHIFSHTQTKDMLLDVRDFQTTGVVAFARGCPFYALEGRSYSIQGRRINVRRDYLQNCIEAVDAIVAQL